MSLNFAKNDMTGFSSPIHSLIGIFESSSISAVNGTHLKEKEEGYLKVHTQKCMCRLNLPNPKIGSVKCSKI